MEIVLLVILALILPPIPVFITHRTGVHFWINIALTLLGWLPGVVHAIYCILTKDQP